MKNLGYTGDEIEEFRLDSGGIEQFPPYLMNRIMGRYNIALQEDLADLDLTLPKARALAVLSVLEGPTISQLASYVMAKQSTLSRSLDSLESEGLLRRRTDVIDNRATRLFITDIGRATFERLWPTMHASCTRMFQGISAEERAAFVATLQKISLNLGGEAV